MNIVQVAKMVHIVGIGGIGASALARVLKKLGKEVSGSDANKSEISEQLESDGIKVKYGNSKENLLNNIDLLIYSNAVPEQNSERLLAERQNIPTLSYPEAVGKLAERYFVIAVAGTNGKTTTTAMIASVLEDAGFDPTAIVGSIVNRWKSNARIGKSKYMVLEADEYKEAFLNYSPDIAVITNIAPDHLDYYKDMPAIVKSFNQFTKRIKKDGLLVANFDDAETNKLSIGLKKLKKSYFGFFKSAEFNPTDIGKLKLQFPGKYNVANALACYAVCSNLGISDIQIKKSLYEFSGTWRRFEKVGLYNKKTEIISDYAHHPDGITALLSATYDWYKGKQILVVFQPHQHNRTKMLYNEFVESFSNSPVHDFIISEIFDVVGREESSDQDVSSQELVDDINKNGKNALYASDLVDCERKVRDVIDDFDVVLFVGAGDIYQVAKKIIV